MKIKTNTLTGPALGWAVAQANGHNLTLEDWFAAMRSPDWRYAYAQDWAQGGPLIEREHIQLQYLGYDNPPYWGATKFTPSAYHRWITFGPTPLIAAMRCFVASRLGESVEVPDELTEGEK